MPLASIMLTSIISCVLSLITLGSSTAFNNLTSIGTTGLFASYLLAASLLLWRRCTGGIQLFKASTSTVINTTGARMVWGPWRIPGIFGIVVNAFACAYMIIVIFFSFWPPELPVTPGNMNYGIVVVGAVVIFSIVWYQTWAKSEYKGPVVEAIITNRD